MKSLVPKQITSILHVSHFLFSKINEQTCFYNLLVFTFLIAEKSIKILFYEIKFGEKVEPHYHIAQILTLLDI